MGSSNELANTGDQNVHCGHGFAIIIQPHVEGLYKQGSLSVAAAEDSQTASCLTSLSIVAS